MAGKEVEPRKERERMVRPACFVSEGGDGRIILKLEMPGVSKDGLDLHYEDNTLQITGRRKLEEKEGTYLVRERRSGTYYQAYTLDDTIDPDTIEASLVDGMLTVTLSRKPSEKPRKITVKGG